MTRLATPRVWLGALELAGVGAIVAGLFVLALWAGLLGAGAAAILVADYLGKRLP